MTAVSDVAVIGAGVVGCAAADHLAAQGARVTVFDEACVASGASGRNAGAVEHPYDEAQAFLYEQTVDIYAQVLGADMPRSPNGVLLLTDTFAEAQTLVADLGQHRGLEPHA